MKSTRSIRIAIIGAVMGLAACLSGPAQAEIVPVQAQHQTYAEGLTYFEADAAAPTVAKAEQNFHLNVSPPHALLLAGLGLLAMFLLAHAKMLHMVRSAVATMQTVWRRDIRPGPLVLMKRWGSSERQFFSPPICSGLTG